MARDKRIPIMFSEAELHDIDQWKFRNKVATRADAVRKMCEVALLAEADFEAIVGETNRFTLHLPPTLRDRIKVYAESQNRSMNAEIVRVLEQKFPPPVHAAARFNQLMERLAVLKGGATDEAVDEVVLELEDIIQMARRGQLKGIDENARNGISNAWEYYEEQIAENSDLIYGHGDLDEAEEHSLSHYGDTSIIVDLDEDPIEDEKP